MECLGSFENGGICKQGPDCKGEKETCFKGERIHITPPVSPSKSPAFCSDAVNYVDWDANVVDLVKQMATIGCCEAKNAVMQFDLPGNGRRVEVQLLITDEEDEFLL